MPLQDQVLPINFGQGVDTKTDPKLVVPGKMVELENAVFDKAGRLSKRNGYDATVLNILGGGGSAISHVYAVKAFNNELICTDSERLYSYSEDLERWVDKGKYQSIKVTDNYVSRSAYDQYFASAAISGNIALYAWTANNTPFAKVVDITTGAVLMSDTALAGSTSTFSCVTRVQLLGSSTLGVFWTDDTASLWLATLDVSSSNVLFNSPVLIASNLVKDGSMYLQPTFDVATASYGAVVTWVKGATFSGTPAGITAKRINTSGTTLSTVTVDAAGRDALLRVIVGSNDAAWFYWVDDTTPTACTLYYSIYDSSFSLILARTSIVTNVNTPQQITALPTSTTTQTLYYTDTSTVTVGVSFLRLFSRNVTTTAPDAFGTQRLAGVDITSDPFIVGSNTYMSVGCQATQFLIDLSDYGAVAKSFSGKATWRAGYPPVQSIDYSATKVGIPTLFFDDVSALAGVNYTFNGMALSDFDFDHQDARQALNVGNIQVWNGGILTMYDGDQTVELGFNQFPNMPLVADSGSGTGPGAGTYRYFAVYQWYDAQGNLHQSAPSPAGSVTMLTSNAIQVYVNYLYLTQKTNASSPVQVILYRTTDDGSIPYRITGILQPDVNSPLSGYLSFVDSYDDADITGNEIIYSNPLIAGSVVENIAPPPAMLMTIHNNRLYVVNSEDSSAWYSKTIQDGTGVSFSDLFAEAVDARGGDVSAIASLDDKFVAYKNEIFFVQSGDGPNDTGAGSTLTNFQLVPSDVGCTESKSVIRIPSGLLFKSAKGIFLADRSLNVSYIGATVEDYNSQSISAATLIKDKTQIRFLTDSGSTLVYDYFFNQWSTFTQHTGTSADIWNDVYVYARTDGNLYQENPTTFLDRTTAYAVKGKTGWMALASIQGFQRVRKLAILGTFAGASSHGVKVSAAYDFSASFSTPIPYSFSGSSGAFQFREMLPRQLCDAIQLVIEEVTTGASGENFSISNMSFEAGMKKGLNKLPPGQTVG